MGNIYDAIKDYMENNLNRCSKCNKPTSESKLQEFNGVCESCYYED